MAILSLFSNFYCLSSPRPLSSPYTVHYLFIHHHFQRCSSCPHRHNLIVCASRKKPSVSKKVKSNAELCNEIQEFLAAVGLPREHVPSTKELSYHGRQDLANIVRRRGYKVIRELLSTSTETSSNESAIRRAMTEKHNVVNASEEESSGQDEKVEELAEDSSLLSESVNTEDHHNSMTFDRVINSDGKHFPSPESSTSSLLQEKVEKFIQNGELDTIEDSDFGILDDNIAEDGKRFIKLKIATGVDSTSVGKVHNQQFVVETDAASTLNEFSAMSSQKTAPLALGNGSIREDCISTDGLSANYNEDLDVETQDKESQAEISHLRFLLHQKELELSQLKQQIEEEKLALSMLRTKAETEISRTQYLISEKDAELHAAEESLSGLEEVEIQYWADGITVEVAGSFNGWYHRIKMDQQPSSNIIGNMGSRKSRLWSTVLWLYPGTYEIKFIVDGHWMVDPQREVVTRGIIHNNILRVDR